MHPRRSCSTHLFGRSLLSGTYLSQIHELLHHLHSSLFTYCQTGSAARSLLHSALVQVHYPGAGHWRRPTKIPIASRHIGNGANGTNEFLIGAGLAPRCCPFPVSSTVAVVNASLAQRIRNYTPCAARKQPAQERGQVASQCTRRALPTLARVATLAEAMPDVLARSH